MSEKEVLTEVRGRAGIITMNRPKAINALTHPMTKAIAAQLEEWRNDDNVEVVILRGAGERGLCAGGDVAALYHDAKAGGTEGADFWADEYQLNLDIDEYPKPFVPFMTGIVLGGGIGLSSHGSHRIVSDDTRVGMPEVGIGFVPDVGGSYLLSQAPDNLGVHLALTASHINAAEAITCGLADDYIPADKIDEVIEKLAETGDINIIDDYTEDLPEGFEADRDAMSTVYSADSVEEILAGLDRIAAEEGEESWAFQAAKRIRRNSPLALKVALESIRRAEGKSLADALSTEYRISCNMQRGHEFVEGVRAQLIDKDRNPQWSPATLEEVSTEEVEAVFGPIQDDRLSDLELKSK